MKSRYAVLAVLTWILVGASLARAESEMLVLVQAADVLSDLITYTNTRADVRVEAMSKFISDAGKQAEFANFNYAGPANTLFFDQVFKGAVLFIRNGGSKYAEPAYQGMSDAQLSDDLTELQVYNIQEFSKLLEKKKLVDKMRAYLTSTGQLENYQKASKDSAAPFAAASTPLEASNAMDLAIKSAKEIEWKKAQLRGVSEADFETYWQQRVEQFRDATAAKVDSVRSLADSLSNPAPPPPAPTAAAPPEVIYERAAPSIPGYVLPSTVQSSYTASMYQQQNNEVWNGFNNW